LRKLSCVVVLTVPHRSRDHGTVGRATMAYVWALFEIRLENIGFSDAG